MGRKLNANCNENKSESVELGIAPSITNTVNNKVPEKTYLICSIA